MHINAEENLNVFGIFDSVILTNPQSLRWTVTYKLLENNSDTQMSFLLLLITFIWTIVNLCTLFHISVANCKWGSVCNVESITLSMGVCKLRTG